jgi:hypothetical protein
LRRKKKKGDDTSSFDGIQLVVLFVYNTPAAL